VDLYVDCGKTAFGKASTVVDLTGGSPGKVGISRKGPPATRR